jgi:L,D-transpeptidase-like protein
MRRHAVILAAALAWLISIEGAEARLDILVEKATQRMLVIQDGYMRYMWPVSTGRDETATPNGVYAPQRLERNWFSTAYYNSPMPFSIFFHRGYAIHGSNAINQLGGPASHGCVRLHPHHAALLFDLVQQEGPDKTTIEVTDEARPDEPSMAGPEIAPERGLYAPVYPPMPKIVRYRETGEMPEFIPTQRGDRPMAARNALPLRPQRPPPAARRMLTDVRPPAAVPRAPCGTGEAGAANGSPRLSDESSDCRPRPKVVEGSPPEQAQQARSFYGFKLLPASCWSGGASRWRAWTTSQGAACK